MVPPCSRSLRMLLVVVFVALVSTGCAAGTGTYTAASPAGFFSGIWHGWIAPVALILHFFNPDVRLYEPNNAGWWYDLGFYIAVIAGFGSLRLTRRDADSKR